MALDFGERLRVVGQWLDAQYAQSADLTVVEGYLSVEGRIAEDTKQSASFTESELEGLSENARRFRVNPFGSVESRWAPCLRTLGQLLQAQVVEPNRIWSEAELLWVSGTQQGNFITQQYRLEDLTSRDRTHERSRQISDLRERTAPRRQWWDRLRAVGT
jgi:hypothetical protein